ncbi:signal peptidase I [Actinacidiphila soli]|uniref:signal peptidase I n=1 Tax=Actinacidiphila soli TaxID=2487275 RepID=UPI000FCA31B2|nr:signal peptidase I [Actinacidiphila soli]
MLCERDADGAEFAQVSARDADPDDLPGSLTPVVHVATGEVPAEGDVVQSGSMRPALMPGDVALYQPPRDVTPAVGQIVLFQDPTRPGQLLTHRVYQVLPNNDLITKGDANSTPDSTPVRPTALQGVARLRVPWIGLSVQLWRAKQLVPEAIVLLGLAMLLALAALPLHGRSRHK